MVGDALINYGSEDSLKNIKSDHVITQVDALLDEEMEMISNVDLKVS